MEDIRPYRIDEDERDDDRSRIERDYLARETRDRDREQEDVPFHIPRD